MRFIRWVVGLILFVGVLLVVLLLFFSYSYQDELKSYVKDQINAQLDAPIDVKNIELSMFSHFPSATVIFHDVLAWDAFPDETSQDTLLYAKKIFFALNLIEVIKGNYTLDRVIFTQADLRIKWNAQGNPNYIIWKTKSDTTSSAIVQVNQLKFERTRLTLEHDKKQWRSWLVARSLTLDRPDPALFESVLLSGDVGAFSFNSPLFSFKTKDALSLQTNVHLDSSLTTWKLSEGKLNAHNIHARFSGGLFFKNNTYGFDISMKNQSLETLRTWIPAEYLSAIEGYAFKGDADVNILTGNHRQNHWNTEMEYAIIHGEVVHMESNESISAIHTKGTAEFNKNNQHVVLKSFSGSYGNNPFSGNLDLNLGNSSRLGFSLDGDFSLPEMIAFLELEGVEKAYGTLSIQAKCSGPIQKKQWISPEFFKYGSIQGSLSTEDLGFIIPAIYMDFDHLQGRIDLLEDQATFSGINGNWKGSQSRVDGMITNLLPFMLNHQETLKIRANARFDHIALERFLLPDSAEESSFHIPDFLDLDVNTKIDRLTYKRFEANSINGKVVVKDGVMHSDRLNFEIAAGTVYGSFELKTNAQNDLLFNTHVLLSQLEINDLFYAFHNFSQNVVRHDQIKGRLSADVNFSGRWDEQLSVIPASLKSNSIVKVTDGELIEIESLQQIGSYLRKNPLTNVLFDTKALDKNVKHIYFDQITNSIAIEDETVKIPSFQLASSVLNLNLSGEHRFDQQIDYKMNFRITELINQRKETEFGLIEDDGTGMRIFMTMKGNASDPVFEMDKASKKEWRQSQWKNEGVSINKELQRIFSGENPKKETESPKQVTLDWEQQEDSAKSVPDETPLHSKPKKYIFEEDSLGTDPPY